MRHPERVYFDELKERILVRFQERQPDCPANFSEWTLKHIELLQGDLQERVKGRISTRWFYDHLKANREDRIPRIDILNLLSAYCEFESWEAFKAESRVAKATRLEAKREAEEMQREEELAKREDEGLKREGYQAKQKGGQGKRKPRRLEKVLIGVTFLLGATLLIAFMTNGKTEYKLCFVDADFGIPIANKQLKITLLEDGHPGPVIEADSNGCLQLNTDQAEVNFVVRADYYRADTFKVVVREQQGEEIRLKVDDYSLLIHQLSVTTSSEDWERRRSQLEEMIHEDAMIFLVARDNQGIELFNREEFIDRMTLPISALKNIRILQTEYRDGKISKMRITQEEDEE